VAVKVAREKHDMRFDVPCVGPQTLETCVRARIAVLALEAGQTLLLDEEQVRAVAARHPVTLVTAQAG
jgi:DUF1009 family protein